jgi:hypothetical protein
VGEQPRKAAAGAAKKRGRPKKKDSDTVYTERDAPRRGRAGKARGGPRPKKAKAAKPTLSPDELLLARWTAAGAQLRPAIEMFGDWQGELAGLLAKSAEELAEGAANMQGALGSGDAAQDEAVAFVIRCVGERLAAQAAKASADETARALVGGGVLKQFGKQQFKGTVTAFDAEYELFHVLYEDGDEEDLDRPEVTKFQAAWGRSIGGMAEKAQGWAAEKARRLAGSEQEQGVSKGGSAAQAAEEAAEEAAAEAAAELAAEQAEQDEEQTRMYERWLSAGSALAERGVALDVFGEWAVEMRQLLGQSAAQLADFREGLRGVQQTNEGAAAACAFFIGCAEELGAATGAREERAAAKAAEAAAKAAAAKVAAEAAAKAEAAQVDKQATAKAGAAEEGLGESKAEGEGEGDDDVVLVTDDVALVTAGQQAPEQQAAQQLQDTTLAATNVAPRREGWLARWTAAGEAVPEVRSACADSGVRGAFQCIQAHGSREELAEPLQALLEASKAAQRADRRACHFMLKVARDWLKVRDSPFPAHTNGARDRLKVRDSPFPAHTNGARSAQVLAAEAAERKVAEREGKASEVGAAKAERARIKALKEAEKARQEASKAEKAAASKAAKAAEKERKEEERAAEKVKREAEKAAAAVAREAKKEADKAAKEAKALENQFALPAGWTESKVAKKDKAGKPTAATATVYLSPTGARVSSKAAVLKMAESEAKKAKTQKRMGDFMMGFLKGAPSPTALPKAAAVELEPAAVNAVEPAAEPAAEAAEPAAVEPAELAAAEAKAVEQAAEAAAAPAAAEEEAEETEEAWLARWVAGGLEVCLAAFPDWEAQALAIRGMDDEDVQNGIDGMGEALESAEQAAMHPALDYVVQYSKEVLARRPMVLIS